MSPKTSQITNKTKLKKTCFRFHFQPLLNCIRKPNKYFSDLKKNNSFFFSETWSGVKTTSTGKKQDRWSWSSCLIWFDVFFSLLQTTYYERSAKHFNGFLCKLNGLKLLFCQNLLLIHITAFQILTKAFLRSFNYTNNQNKGLVLLAVSCKFSHNSSRISTESMSTYINSRKLTSL